MRIEKLIYFTIIAVILFIFTSVRMWAIYVNLEKKLDELKLKYENQKAISQIKSLWIRNLIHDRKMFSSGNVSFSKIAIYGIGDLGKCLVEELREEGIEIGYIIDKRASQIKEFDNIKVFNPDEELPSTDLIIVTAIFYFDEIAYELKKKVSCPIISLEEIVNYEKG